LRIYVAFRNSYLAKIQLIWNGSKWLADAVVTAKQPDLYPLVSTHQYHERLHGGPLIIYLFIKLIHTKNACLYFYKADRTGLFMQYSITIDMMLTAQ